MGHEGDKLKLYVRLPVKIKEELDIKNLHPDILTVQIPRQKSRRWCFVAFKDRETLLKVRTHLRKTQINGKKIIVLPYQRGKPSKKGKKKPIKPEEISTSVDPLLSLLKKEEKE